MAGYRWFLKRGLVTVLFAALAALAGCGENDTDISAPALTFKGLNPVTTTRTRQLSGTLEPGATVSVTVTPAATVGPVTVDQGTWACTVENLADGTSTINIKAADVAGNQTVLALAVTYDALSIETFVTPIADGGTGLTIGGLVDPSVTDPITVDLAPTDPSFAATRFTAVRSGDTWSAAVNGLGPGNNTLTATAILPGPVTIEKSVVINVNPAAPLVSIEQPQGEILIPSQVVSGSLDPAATSVSVVPLPADGPTIVAGTWSATLNRLVSGKNPITASVSANNVTATARGLLRYNSLVPLLREVSPANSATGVAVDTVVTAEFATAMNGNTMTPGTFTLDAGTGPVTASVVYDEATRTVQLTPAAPLAPGTTHTATLATGITDQNGVPLPQPLVWSFTTTP